MDEAFVMLLHNDEGYPYVLISDYPDAPLTVGAQKTRSFPHDSSWGWPEEARAYADGLSKANGNCLIEYEAWMFRDFGDEDEMEDDEYVW